MAVGLYAANIVVNLRRSFVFIAFVSFVDLIAFSVRSGFLDMPLSVRQRRGRQTLCSQISYRWGIRPSRDRAGGFDAPLIQRHVSDPLF